MINPVPEYCHHFLYPLVGNRMLELGNKKSNINGKFHTYKDYFVSEGFEHVSVDINGLDGALPLDLRNPIDLGKFDMVTNYGTTEHVEGNQAQVWENIHKAVDVDGVLICMCPAPGDWWWHGIYYPTKEFYTQFAERNGYEIEHMEIGREHPNRNIDVRMMKIDDLPFQMPDASTMYRNELRNR